MQERRKVEDRLPAALAFIAEHKLNELLPGELDDVGIMVMGGLANGVLRALARLDLADAFGQSRVPLLLLNVVYPLVPQEVRAFCAGKRAVLVVEEGFPDYIEQAVHVELRRAGLPTRVHGKDVLAKTGEYQSDVLLAGLPASARRRGRLGSILRRSPSACARCLPTRKRALPPSVPCRRGRRPSAPAVRNGRCSPPSS